MIEKEISQGLFGKTVGYFLIFVFFLMGCNQLINLPLDKLVMFMFLVGLILRNIYQGIKISITILLTVCILTTFVLLTYLFNLPSSSPIVFFPVLGLFFALLVAKEPELIEILYWGLFIHLVIGLCFVFSSYIIGMNSYVHPMYDKGVPFLHAAKGFTTTVQSFGTLGISWFLIYYFKKDRGEVRRIDKIAYYIVLFAIFCTFNRNTLLIFLVLLFFKHKKIFVAIFIVLGVFYLYFFDFINSVLFNVSTLDSRSDLLQAFRIAFFEQTGWIGYLIGNGNNTVPQEIAVGTVYKTGYIENGTSVLLYTYGFIGYLAYLVAVTILSLMFWIRDQVFYACITFYIFIIAQQFTHEFFSNTFYLLFAALLLILNAIDKIEEKNSILSSAE